MRFDFLFIHLTFYSSYLSLTGFKLIRFVNTLRPRQNGRHFADDMFKCIFLNENTWIPIEILLKLVPQGPINNIPALVQIMAWRRLGDKPLSGPMMVRLPTHICVTRPQWVKGGPTVEVPWIPRNHHPNTEICQCGYWYGYTVFVFLFN